MSDTKQAGYEYFQWLLLAEADTNNCPAGLEAHALHRGLRITKKVIVDHCVCVLHIEDGESTW